MRRRTVALLLAAIMVLTPNTQILAASPGQMPAAGENQSGALSEAGNGPVEGGEQQGASTAELPSVSGGNPEKGGQTEEVPQKLPDDTVPFQMPQNPAQLEVVIAPVEILEKEVPFQVALTNGETENRLETIMLGKAEQRIVMPDLPDGAYTLQVTAPGFAAYEQTLEIKGQGYSLELLTGAMMGIQYVEGSPHPGLLLLGDVTGDGKIGDDDRTQLVDAIERGTNEDSFDLNLDEEVNLVDLEYFARSYQSEKHTQATVSASVSSKVLQGKVSEETQVTGGSVEALLDGTGSITVEPKDSETISAEHPVELVFNVAENAQADTDGIVIESSKENPITSAEVTVAYVDENGQEQTLPIPVEAGVQYLLRNSDVTVTMDADGKIQIHLGSQVAVKKVSLKITGTKNHNLAEISKVEFVNGMEDRIPEVKMDIPEHLAARIGSKQFTLTWDSCTNVTGYEVSIVTGGVEEIHMTKAPMLLVTSFGGKELVNNTEFTVKVQSVNGTWKSGYSESITAVPKPDQVPDAPDNVAAEGKYKSIQVSWKKMKDTDSYRLFYREADTEDAYTVIDHITANSYTISDLKDKTEYEVYVTGVNELGEGAPSLTSKAVTLSLDAVKMPEYKLINTGEEGKAGAHIVSVSRVRGEMKDSPLDTAGKTAWGLADHDPASHFYVEDWDEGGSYPDFNGKGFTFEFDQNYVMDTIGFSELSGEGIGKVTVEYWDETAGKYQRLSNVKVERRMDSEGKAYGFIRMEDPVETNRLRFGVGRSASNVRTITLSEVYFYHYDSLQDDIMNLFEDETHTVLKKEVTKAVIDALNERVQTKDSVSGEYHPDKDRLERELQNARDILNHTLSEPVQIYNTITTRDVGRGFGGLNAWQPLGVTAAAGEEVTLYVGHNSLPIGAKTNLQLVVSQYHAESSAFVTTVNTSLQVGRNDITIPKIGSTDTERGGALYIQYTGNNANDRFAVRVNGGVAVPRLDLYRVTDPAERLARVEKYVQELKEYTAKIETLHEEHHANSENSNVHYAYDEMNCILGATDILMETMMLSLPAQQILAGCNGDARTLLDSMDAMEDMMELFYQHKGLNRTAKDAVDQLPKGHLNIRYQRMFAGAFMYAGGNHIGIEWPETRGMANASPVESENGKYQSGRYFGWGIAHEIGHNINQSAYVVAEITNNYFAQLAQAEDTNEGMRFTYPNIYEKVTSGTIGKSQNIATQLGMYWQLHLAYDNGYNYKTYDTYEEQLANLFYARVDTYARTPGKAPQPGGTALKLAGDKDQDLMRLSCAAAEKNILEFFRRWGMVPNEETIAYAQQFAQETRAIYYVSDDSRVYRLENAGSSLNAEGTVEAVGDNVSAEVNAQNKSQVDFVLGSKNIPAEDVLGYEIVRTTISGGEVERELAGFSTETAFSDYITTMNHRVITYEVTVIDKYLNRSAVKTLAPIKIEHDGSLDKEFWTVKTENLEAKSEGESTDADVNMPCEPVVTDPVLAAVDNDSNTTYLAELTGAKAGVTMEFNRFQVISGLKYTVYNPADGFERIKTYTISLRNEKGEWQEAAGGTFDDTAEVQTIYFGNEDGKYVSTYRTDAVKLEISGAKGERIAVTELDVLGVTGDNVDFRSTEDGIPAIGKLVSDYQYGEKNTDVIPAGSVIFTGSYKGNPAYNVVLLYDQDGNIVGGADEEGNLKAQQIILADVQDGAPIQEVYDGTWIYWIGPQDYTEMTGKSVRAELYRVNNAATNEGQRLVSDSLMREIPDRLPDIELTGNRAAGEE